MEYFYLVSLFSASLMLNISALASVTQEQEEVLHINPKEEVQLKQLTPSVKSVNIKLEGTEREREALDLIHNIVRETLDNSKLGVVSVPVEGEPVVGGSSKVFENLEIVINVKAARMAAQPYLVGLTLQEMGTKGTPRYFDYMPGMPEDIRQQLQRFLTEALNLKPKSSSAKILPTITAAEKTSVTPEIMPFQPVQQVVEPGIVDMPTSTKNREEGISIRVSPQDEVQLKNPSTAVKSINIKLEGTIREQTVLSEVENMVKTLLNSSKLGVVRVPVKDEPMASNKVYEHLEIVINAASPREVGNPYTVSITLQEIGGQGEPRIFAYQTETKEDFQRLLNAYLTQNLNLQPRSQPSMR